MSPLKKKVREIFEWGYDIDIPKTIVKSPNMRLSTPSAYNRIVHKMESTLGESFKVQLSDFRFNHYRGMPKENSGHSKYMEEHKISSFDKIDTGMGRFL